MAQDSPPSVDQTAAPAKSTLVQLNNRDMTTALVHLYRGEISRQNAWRHRLDVTTNWALIATGAALTFAFGDANAHHSVILLDAVLVTLFLFIESRSYRYFDLWSYRIRLIECNFYGSALLGTPQPDSDWQALLGQTLVDPHFTITIWEALGRRLRRNYVWLYLVIDLAWLAKLFLMSGNVLSVGELTRRAAMGVVPGAAVMLLVLAVNLVLLALSLITMRLQRSSAEVQAFEDEPKPPVAR